MVRTLVKGKIMVFFDTDNLQRFRSILSIEFTTSWRNFHYLPIHGCSKAELFETIDYLSLLYALTLQEVNIRTSTRRNHGDPVPYYVRYS